MLMNIKSDADYFSNDNIYHRHILQSPWLPWRFENSLIERILRPTVHKFQNEQILLDRLRNSPISFYSQEFVPANNGMH